MSKIVNIQNINPNNFQLQNYTLEDESLINNNIENIILNPLEDYLEYYILDLNKNILFNDINGYPKYQLRDNILTLDPQNNLESEGYTEGQYYTVYNFLKRKLNSSPQSTLYIQDISSDRTELRLNTTSISNEDIINLTNEFSLEISSSLLNYKDFYLNFGKNKLIIANNILLDNSDPNNSTILIKLYESLPSDFKIKDELWIVEKIAESISYQIELIEIFEFEETSNFLQSPNFNLDIKDQINNSTNYTNLNNLSLNTSISGSGSFIYQINSILEEKGIELNIDYTSYDNFIHFSSAQTRLENFYYKLSLIEQYTFSGSYSDATPLNSYTSESQLIWNNKINDIITNFDGYEYYLYFESSSYSWPKINATPPFKNYLTTDAISTSWLNDMLSSASLYDSENNNSLVNSIPTYLREDPINVPYELFIQMIGQHFDNIWIYIKDITNKFNADNRLNYGISKDLVSQAIKDLGIKIYQNNFSEMDLYSSLLGISPSGSTFINPYTTSTLPPPLGYEYITTYITASNSSSLSPLDDVNKEIYKRIYHNTPYLLKKKGTLEGLRALINIYGIPDSILRIKEFGGKSNITKWDNFQNQFNYEFSTTSSGYLHTNWSNDSLDNPPKTVEFRFKTNGIPVSGTSSFSQSLAFANNDFQLVLEYTGSGFLSGSYSASLPSNYNQYGTIKLISSSISSSIYLPLFDGNWWSLMVTQNALTNSLYVKNKIYNGYDGNSIGFESSASFISSNSWPSISGSFYLSTGSDQTINGKTYNPFSGSFQELRFYNIVLNENNFDDFVMNPLSIEGNDISGSQSAQNSLFFRAPLGTVSDITSSRSRISIHPSISGSNISQSFYSGNSNYFLSGSYNFIPQNEVFYQNQVAIGIKNSTKNKIRQIDEILPTGNTLSPYISLQQTNLLSESFDKDINYIEVAFSPQDEINDDIISQLGSFNIGDYIGDPRQISSSFNYYPDFNKLRDNYFLKYTHNYDIWDYVRLIKFYDNSLFKMIKDFIPAKTNLSSGIIIKQTFLERNKYPLPQATMNSTITYLGSATSKTKNIPY